MKKQSKKRASLEKQLLADIEKISKSTYKAPVSKPVSFKQLEKQLLSDLKKVAVKEKKAAKRKLKPNATEKKKREKLRRLRISRAALKKKYLKLKKQGKPRHDTYTNLLKVNSHIANLVSRDQSETLNLKKTGWHRIGGWWVATAVMDFWNWFKVHKKLFSVINDFKIPKQQADLILDIEDLILEAGNYDLMYVKYNVEFGIAYVYLVNYANK